MYFNKDLKEGSHEITEVKVFFAEVESELEGSARILAYKEEVEERTKQ